MVTAVYIGAGLDLIPLVLFRHMIHTFIYVDCQPLTEFANVQLCPEYERPEFLRRVNNKMVRFGFSKTLVSKNLNVYVHDKSGVKVYYYTSQRFPHSIDTSLVKAISEASVLICCGHTPNAQILSMMKPGPKIFIGDNKSCYLYDNEDDELLIQKIHTDPSLFSSYLRFSIPDEYKYWLDDEIITDIKNFKVTEHLSLKNLFSSRNS